jgi:hypothetical protein
MLRLEGMRIGMQSVGLHVNSHACVPGVVP